MKQGIASQLAKDQDYINALASGGLIRFNSLLEGNRADHTRKLIKDFHYDLRRKLNTSIDAAVGRRLFSDYSDTVVTRLTPSNSLALRPLPRAQSRRCL